ncbi:MAG: hypothetical protein RBU30_11535 [Polyangia bacterium]|jgi:tetratricopeptide (TPR) repeat protein|nr:hypothetical protein [Polyangia bacterium]
MPLKRLFTNDLLLLSLLAAPISLIAAAPRALADCPGRSYDPVVDRAAAKRFFERGIKYWGMRYHFDALKAWTCSYSIVPHHLVAFNIGRAAEATKKYEIALKYFRIFLAQAENPTQRKTVTERIRAVEEKLTLIEGLDGAVKWPEYRPPASTTEAVQQCPRHTGVPETDRKNAGHWYTVGLKHFQQKQFLSAMSAWLCSFRLVEHHLAAFNVARAAEAARKLHIARSYYNLYLKMNPGAPDRIDVEIAITRVHKEILEAEKRAEQIQVEDSKPRASPPPPHGAAPVKSLDMGEQDVSPSGSKRKSKLKLALGWGSVGLAGLLGVLAVSFGLTARNAKMFVMTAEPGTSWKDELAGPYRDYYTFSKAGWTCAGLGAAALGTGVLLLIFDSRERHPKAPPRVKVSVAPGGAGVSVGIDGSF